MAKGEIFVGRKEELAEFAKVLERPDGEVVLVVGQAGIVVLGNNQLRSAEPQRCCRGFLLNITAPRPSSRTL